MSAARTTAAALARDFGLARPRLAIAGLNPHAGEDGHMGREEITLIRPAMEILRSEGFDVSGPWPPDTMFTPQARRAYDAAICMYHDQALIPLKTLDMSGGVNVTLGLPIVRTSPDHGTALRHSRAGPGRSGQLDCGNQACRCHRDTKGACCMTPVRLGVNIDHVATLRNARGGTHPDPLAAAEAAIAAGADGITLHLREDRRHIRDADLQRIRAAIAAPINLEMAATEEMVRIAIEAAPHACCIVPERRAEVTTEGGLDAAGQYQSLAPLVAKLSESGIRVSLFIDPDTAQLEAAARLGGACGGAAHRRLCGRARGGTGAACFGSGASAVAGARVPCGAWADIRQRFRHFGHSASGRIEHRALPDWRGHSGWTERNYSAYAISDCSSPPQLRDSATNIYKLSDWYAFGLAALKAAAYGRDTNCGERA